MSETNYPLKKNGLKKVLTLLKNWFALKAEAVFSVNKTQPVDGDVTIREVPFAVNLSSDKTQDSEGEFIIRTSGGSASIEDGDAYALRILGNRVHTGYVAEQLNMTVIPMTRTEGQTPITATIDRDTFVAYVDESGTTTLTYSTEWSADPTDYGITVTGTPIAGDQITVVYVKEERGTITQADPDELVSTGWNLYDHTNGYAYVHHYSDQYGFKIGGTYTAVAFAETPEGTTQTITPVNGAFNVPKDGYVIVTGGNDTDTYIINVWSDWTEGPSGGFEAYSETGVDLTTIMSTYFPYGLMRVADVRDEINLNIAQAISRIGRMAYSAENLASAQASGRPYEADENYIYIVKDEETASTITQDGSYTASDHGNEFFTGTTVAVYLETIYGNNLKNKLERDVVTISGGLVNSLDSTATDKALTAAQGKVLNDQIGNLIKTVEITTSTSANGNGTYTFSKDVIVLSAYTKNSDETAIAYPANNSSISGNTLWYFHVTSAVSPFSPVQSSSKKIYATYIET